MRLDDGLGSVFVLGGGYKYCQLGEGNAFLRVPPDCELRPVVTGWFSEFRQMGQVGSCHAVEYGSGAARFAGATYDPVSNWADHRGDLLRLGPATCLSDAQICDAVDRLGQVMREDLAG